MDGYCEAVGLLQGLLSNRVLCAINGWVVVAAVVLGRVLVSFRVLLYLSKHSGAGYPNIFASSVCLPTPDFVLGIFLLFPR